MSAVLFLMLLLLPCRYAACRHMPAADYAMPLTLMVTRQYFDACRRLRRRRRC